MKSAILIMHKKFYTFFITLIAALCSTTSYAALQPYSIKENKDEFSKEEKNAFLSYVEENNIIQVLEMLEDKDKAKGYLSYKKSDSFNKNAIMIAIEKGYTNMAKVLINKDNELNTGCISQKHLLGNTLLHFAASHNNIKIVKLLVDYGANINAKNDNEKKPLDLIQTSDEELKRELTNLLTEQVEVESGNNNNNDENKKKYNNNPNPKSIRNNKFLESIESKFNDPAKKSKKMKENEPMNNNNKSNSKLIMNNVSTQKRFKKIMNRKYYKSRKKEQERKNKNEKPKTIKTEEAERRNKEYQDLVKQVQQERIKKYEAQKKRETEPKKKKEEEQPLKEENKGFSFTILIIAGGIILLLAINKYFFPYMKRKKRKIQKK